MKTFDFDINKLHLVCTFQNGITFAYTLLKIRIASRGGVSLAFKSQKAETVLVSP